MKTSFFPHHAKILRGKFNFWEVFFLLFWGGGGTLVTAILPIKYKYQLDVFYNLRKMLRRHRGEFQRPG